ncbi:hypothetical protein JKF63_01734 [Porcisia hertigi]|uniref:3'-5' exonuclease n=1 Tax=Porcisia hertigi TaxID=2761500 RepID=A0A836H599_9TRYP|nr:hypothetical protein JKF63_01734 [Porcisia hertigi]
MNTITSSAVTTRLCGVFVPHTEAWLSFGECMWIEMMQTLRQQPPHLRIIGFDSEWFMKSPLSVVQFATSSHCFVLHIAFFDGRLLPAAVIEALCDPGIIKCGVGIKNDISRIQEEQEITLQSVLDVAEYSILLRLHSGPKTNLKVLAESVANLTIEKDQWITRSNWELPLWQNQVNYAAEDALASYLVGRAVMMKASEDFNMDTGCFDVAEWLHRTAPIAVMELKKMQRNYANQAMEEREKTGPPSERSTAKVCVLDMQGNFCFECSRARAKFYLLEKSLAVCTKHAKGKRRRALEIQLLFDPKVKMRLCTHHSLGSCELQNQCPFAHGLTELHPAAAALMESQAPSCACCLGTKGLVRHAITPPSFRKFMPLPQRTAQIGDFLPVCQQCMSVVRVLYENEMTSCHAEAKKSNRSICNLGAVVKCTAYARLPLGTAHLKKIPPPRSKELQQFVNQNWRSTFFEDFNPGFEIGEPVVQNTEFLRRLAKIDPGDVSGKVTMSILVGDDQEKARQFNQRWRDCSFGKFGMIEKKSNHMTNGDWKTYRRGSAVPLGDIDHDATLQSGPSDAKVSV